jgi:hypothetical protein
MALAERISEQELERRMLSVENAVAQQELEGLTVAPETIEDMRSVASGEMTTDQVIQNIHARLHSAAPLKS